MDLKRGINKAVEMVVAHLKEVSQEVGDSDAKIEQVASISTNNDSAIGKLIAKPLAKSKKAKV